MNTNKYALENSTSTVLWAVKPIVYKRNINYNIFNNDSYLYDYDNENETYATNGNNHQFFNKSFSDSRNNLTNLYNTVSGGGDDKVMEGGENEINNYWALLAIILVFGTAAGNILVCLAIAWEKRLQNVTNYFLASLAITDLMVAGKFLFSA